jgi:hypothetical protein
VSVYALASRVLSAGILLLVLAWILYIRK